MLQSIAMNMPPLPPEISVPRAQRPSKADLPLQMRRFGAVFMHLVKVECAWGASLAVAAWRDDDTRYRTPGMIYLLDVPARMHGTFGDLDRAIRAALTPWRDTVAPVAGLQTLSTHPWESTFFRREEKRGDLLLHNVQINTTQPLPPILGGLNQHARVSFHSREDIL